MHKKPNFQTGFTLIEVMIVVVIVAILASIAVPAYQGYIIRAKRTDGKAGLLALQQAQEKYRANCPQYASAISTATPPSQTCTSGSHNLVSPTASPESYYTLGITSAQSGSSSYKITATPTFTDSECNVLTITLSSGVYTSGISGSGTANKCWQK